MSGNGARPSTFSIMIFPSRREDAAGFGLVSSLAGSPPSLAETADLR